MIVHTCRICGVQFRSSNASAAHCPQCDRRLWRDLVEARSRRVELREHNRFTCTVCGISYPSNTGSVAYCPGCQQQNRQERESDATMDSIFGEGYRASHRAERKKTLHTAKFIKEIPKGWRGKQTALYKLSLPLQDYDFVVCNSLITVYGNSFSTFERDEIETCIYGSSDEGEVADMTALCETHTLSHTETLLKAGYNLALTLGEGSEQEMSTWIDKWDVTGTSVDKDTGRPKVYTVSRSARDEWGCSCPAWVFRRGGKVDCQHISAKKLQLIQQGVTVVPIKRTPTQEAKPRQLRLED